MPSSVQRRLLTTQNSFYSKFLTWFSFLPIKIFFGICKISLCHDLCVDNVRTFYINWHFIRFHPALAFHFIWIVADSDKDRKILFLYKIACIQHCTWGLLTFELLGHNLNSNKTIFHCQTVHKFNRFRRKSFFRSSI